MRFSWLTRAILKQAGWHPGRRVELSAEEQRLDELYAADAAARAKRILQEFSGLFVSPGKAFLFGWILPSYVCLEFGVEHAAPETYQPFESAIGPCCPIAYESYSFLDHVITGDGAIYAFDSSRPREAACEVEVYIVGENTDEAIERMIRAKRYRLATTVVV